jgi:release factor glutamine methyltransferase
MLWGELLVQLEAEISNAGVADAAASARRIVEQASGFYGSEWVDCVNSPVSDRSYAAARSMAQRRTEGEPLQYVLGSWAFRQLDVLIDRRVLIPRPETEQVAGWAIEELQRLGETGEIDAPLKVADLGTGSGVIGLSLAKEVPWCQVFLSDTSEGALSVARANLAGLGMAGAGVTVRQGSWFEAFDQSLQGSLDLIVSNPPYVAENDDLGPGVLEWEPTEALFAGTKGTEDLELLIEQSGMWLKPSGVLVLEMAPWQTAEMQSLALRFLNEVELRSDFSGRQRCLIARHPLLSGASERNKQ